MRSTTKAKFLAGLAACAGVAGIALAPETHATDSVELNQFQLAYDMSSNLQSNWLSKTTTSGYSTGSVAQGAGIYKCVVDAYNLENGTSISSYASLTDAQLASIKQLNCYTYGNLSYNGAVSDIFDPELNRVLPKLTNLTLLGLQGGYGAPISVWSLNLTNNSKLTTLSLQDTRISEIDLSAQTALERLTIVDSPIKNLDLSKQANLSDLTLSSLDNLLHLDLSSNPNLTKLFVIAYALRDINLSKNIKLESLSLYALEIDTVDISALKNLQKLNTSGVANIISSVQPKISNDGKTIIDFNDTAWLKFVTDPNTQTAGQAIALPSDQYTYDETNRILTINDPATFNNIIPIGHIYNDAEGVEGQYLLFNLIVSPATLPQASAGAPDTGLFTGTIEGSTVITISIAALAITAGSIATAKYLRKRHTSRVRF